MSANNAARFYWAKLRKATTIFEGGDLEQAQDICCQIGNDLRSPKFCQIEAWKLRSRCLPSQYDYWLAKSNLEQALGVCEDCKSDTAQAQAGKLDRKALAQIKKEVESMLQGRLGEYNQYWHDKGREPPSSQDELYDILETASDDPDAEEWYEVVRDEKGNEVAGPVSRWPFMGPVPSSDLLGKTLPPMAAAPMSQAQLQRAEEQERWYNEKQDDETIEAMELGSKGVTTGVKAVEATAQELQQLTMSQAVKDYSDSEMGEAGGVPLPPSPAGSE